MPHHGHGTPSKNPMPTGRGLVGPRAGLDWSGRRENLMPSLGI